MAINRGAVDSIPNAMQLAGGNRKLLKLFSGMSDEEILRWSARMDEMMSEQYRKVGSDDYADALLKRANAIRRVLERLDEKP